MNGSDSDQISVAVCVSNVEGVDKDWILLFGYMCISTHYLWLYSCSRSA